MVAPTVVANTATTAKGKAVTVNVLANDTYGASPVVTFHATQPTGVTRVSTTQCTHATQGQWDIVANQVVYTPSASFTGTAAAIQYTLTDAGGNGSSTVTVTVSTPSDYSGDRISEAATIAAVGRKGRHSGGGRAVDVTLTSELTAGEGIDLAKLGLNRLDAIQVLVANTGSNINPVAGSTIASGSTVRFIGN